MVSGPLNKSQVISTGKEDLEQFPCCLGCGMWNLAANFVGLSLGPASKSSLAGLLEETILVTDGR